MTTIETTLPTPQTVEEALAICDRLQKESKAQGLPVCVRARRGQADLTRPGGFWTESADRLEIYFAGMAKVCCGCHKVGTFDPFPRQTRRR
jgi:hypothetical protein